MTHHFKTLTDSHSVKLDQMVSEYLQKGWELYGSPFAMGQYQQPTVCLTKSDAVATGTKKPTTKKAGG